MNQVAGSNGQIRLGLIVTDIEDRTDNYTHSWQTMKDMVQMAEDVGFYSAWIPDHLIHEPVGVERYGIWESWSVVTALLAVTSKIRVGSHVLCTGWRNPALIAKMADTVDEISNGRLILALAPAGTNRNTVHSDSLSITASAASTKQCRSSTDYCATVTSTSKASSTLRAIASCARVVQATVKSRS